MKIFITTLILLSLSCTPTKKSNRLIEPVDKITISMHERIRDAGDYLPESGSKWISDYKSIGTFDVFKDPDSAKYTPLFRCYSYKRSHWISKDKTCKPEFYSAVKNVDDVNSCGSDIPCIINEGLIGYVLSEQESDDLKQIFTCESKIHHFTAQKLVDDSKYCEPINTKAIPLGWVENYQVKNTVRIYMHRRKDHKNFVPKLTSNPANNYESIGGFNLLKDHNGSEAKKPLVRCFAYRRSHWISKGDCQLSYKPDLQESSEDECEIKENLLTNPCFYREGTLGYSKEYKTDEHDREIFTCQANNYKVTDQKVVDDESECPENTTAMSLGYVSSYDVKPTGVI